MSPLPPLARLTVVAGQLVKKAAAIQYADAWMYESSGKQTPGYSRICGRMTMNDVGIVVCCDEDGYVLVIAGSNAGWMSPGYIEDV